MEPTHRVRAAAMAPFRPTCSSAVLTACGARSTAGAVVLNRDPPRADPAPGSLSPGYGGARYRGYAFSRAMHVSRGDESTRPARAGRDAARPRNARLTGSRLRV